MWVGIGLFAIVWYMAEVEYWEEVAWLCVNWAMIAVITGGLIVTLRDKKAGPDTPESKE